MIRTGLLSVLLLYGGALASQAEAHAFLTKASPPVGATVPAPKSVAITFTEGVEPAFSTIVVQDAQGQRVDAGDIHSESGNGLVLAVGLKPLVSGTYTVIWHATSVDTHKTEGRFIFNVQP